MITKELFNEMAGFLSMIEGSIEYLYLEDGALSDRQNCALGKVDIFLIRSSTINDIKVFLNKFDKFRNHHFVFEGTFKDTSFYKITAKVKIFNVKLMIAELRNCFYSYNDVQLKLLTSEIIEAHDSITRIINFINNDFENFTLNWSDLIQKEFYNTTKDDSLITINDVNYERKYYLSLLSETIEYLEIIKGIPKWLNICDESLAKFIHIVNTDEGNNEYKANNAFEAKKVVNELSDDEKKNIVEKILSPLSGFNPSKQSIMNPEEFNRLLEYTFYLVLNKELHKNISPIKKMAISNEHIRFTFYLIHQEVFGKRRQQVFIDFIHAVFCQFHGTSPKTTYAKFSQPPSSYYKDFAGYFGDEL